MKSVWQQYTATAEKFNEPGKFTAMIGYEWTSVPGGNNLHRNILFRDGKAKADQMLPFSAWKSEDPEKLWAWMDELREEDRRQAARDPHNANLSNGRMFELGRLRRRAAHQEYAERRARLDCCRRSIQTKGAARCTRCCRQRTSCSTSASPAGSTAT